MKPNNETMPEISLRTLVSEAALNATPVPEATSTTAVTSSAAYHELDVVPVREVDLIEQLERNLQTLAYQQSRLQFLMREIRYLMKM